MWIPAFAGMTVGGGNDGGRWFDRLTTNGMAEGFLDSGFRGNDGLGVWDWFRGGKVGLGWGFLDSGLRRNDGLGGGVGFVGGRLVWGKDFGFFALLRMTWKGEDVDSRSFGYAQDRFRGNDELRWFDRLTTNGIGGGSGFRLSPE